MYFTNFSFSANVSQVQMCHTKNVTPVTFGSLTSTNKGFPAHTFVEIKAHKGTIDTTRSRDLNSFNEWSTKYEISKELTFSPPRAGKYY